MLTYLLFESSDEQAYVKRVKSEIDEQFDQINVESAYYIKKSVRKKSITLRILMMPNREEKPGSASPSFRVLSCSCASQPNLRLTAAFSS